MASRRQLKESIEYRKEIAENALFDYFVALTKEDWDSYYDEDFDKMVKETIDIATKNWYNKYRK